LVVLLDIKTMSFSTTGALCRYYKALQLKYHN